MYTAQAKLKPILEYIEITQNNLNLVDSEMENLEELKNYIQAYHTPIWYEVVSVTITK